MKKKLLCSILLCFTINAYSQDYTAKKSVFEQQASTTKVDVSVDNNDKEDMEVGVISKGNGNFVYQAYMETKYFKTAKKYPHNKEIFTNKIKKLASEKNTTFEITDVSYNNTNNTIKLNFTLKNIDGSIYLTKDEAIEDLKKLKELLDLDLLTKDEFDSKAEVLKKIILN